MISFSCFCGILNALLYLFSFCYENYPLLTTPDSNSFALFFKNSLSCVAANSYDLLKFALPFALNLRIAIRLFGNQYFEILRFFAASWQRIITFLFQR